MYKSIATLILILPITVFAASAEQMLKKADSYRQNADEVKVATEIKLYKNNQLQKQRLYDVFIKPNRQSLVISRSPSEKGQKVLMLDDRFWLLLPKTKRPIRITPMQKLLGEASSGDVATMRWNEDYDAEVMSDNGGESGTIELLLTAKRRGVSYKKIHLSLDSNSHKPLRAELYLLSGKLAKIATFEFGTGNTASQVTKMTLQDKIKKQQRTEIRYLSITPYQLANKYYNPAYLAKNPRLAL